MVESIPFRNVFNQMNGWFQSANYHQRFNYHHHFQFQKLRSLSSVRQNRCSIGIYSYIAKVIIVVLLLFVCILNMKIAFEQQTRFEKRKLVYSLDELESINDDLRLARGVNWNSVDEEINFQVSVLSSHQAVRVTVDKNLVYEDARPENGRGIHLIMLNQKTGLSMGSRHFDTHLPGNDQILSQFIDLISDKGRLLVLAVKAEGSKSLTKKVRRNLALKLGSKYIEELNLKGLWALITTAGGLRIAEKLEKYSNEMSDQLFLNSTINRRSLKDYSLCNWKTNAANKRRVEFCSRHDGYGDLCSCFRPLPYNLSQNKIAINRITDVPVMIIASNRPQYLYRCLSSIFSAHGVDPEMIVVFIDGHFMETMDVVELFGVRGFYHTPIGVRSARISQHYRSSFKATFNLFPTSKYAIIIEEDLDVSVDFFRYFNHFLPTLEEDSTLFCISAWNDHGYKHSVVDPKLFYRVESMPGLGWMLKRSLFEEELLPNWPTSSVQWDWDIWMRKEDVRRGRECIVPDVPRTYHFGVNGVNMNQRFFDLYFASHQININDSVVYPPADDLMQDQYERMMHNLVKDGAVVDHTKSPCDSDFVDGFDVNKNLTVYFNYNNDDLNSETFIHILKCLKLWDLDQRGLHKATFRTFIRGRSVTFVGHPKSPYSNYKPVHITPIIL